MTEKDQKAGECYTQECTVDDLRRTSVLFLNYLSLNAPQILQRILMLGRS
jgi:hypothetical protein